MTLTYQIKMLRINSVYDLRPSSCWKTKRNDNISKKNREKDKKMKGTRAKND